MIGWILERTVPWQMRRLEFPAQANPEAAANIGEVIETFLVAARAGMRGATAGQLMALEAQVPWYRRPFFWEGHGFGVSALHACSFASGNPMSRYHAPGFRFMFYTGMGFWNGVATRYHLPKVALDPARWSEQADFEACLPLVQGGSSFALAASAGRWDARSLGPMGLSPQGSESERLKARGAWMGCGRALWFLHMRDFEALNQALGQMPTDMAQDVAWGLGVAITYTQLSEPERIPVHVNALGEPYRASVQAGVRLCLAACLEDDPRVEATLRALDEPLLRWLNEGQRVLEATPRSREFAVRISTSLRQPPAPLAAPSPESSLSTGAPT